METKPDLKKIIELWYKLQNISKDDLRIYELSRRNPWDYQFRKSVEEATELDPEGLTVLLILDNFRDDFFSSCGISIKDILENQNFNSFISDCRLLSEMLSEEEIANALAFIEQNNLNEYKSLFEKRWTEINNTDDDILKLRLAQNSLQERSNGYGK